jgi:copper homeostasis protein
MLEIAVFTLPSALTAASSGASRLELCTSYSSGGTTPQLSTLHTIRTQISPPIPINVMIRPRAGNFYYSASEFEQMRQDVVRFRALASGFVFGILDASGDVDVSRNCELVDLAAPLACTFHRAVDECTGVLEQAVEKIVVCGFRGILTSGGGKTAEEGMGGIKRLVERFGEEIQIIAGGRVRSGNVDGVKNGTGVKWVHSAAITGEGEEVDGEEVRRLRSVLEGMGT